MMKTGGEAASATGAVLDALPHIAWITDPTGRTTFYNRRWYEATGQERGAEDPRAAIHLDDLDTVYRAWVRAAAAGEPMDVEYRLRMDDGSYRWHDARVAPLYDDGGRLHNWVGIAADIDERKRAQREAQAVLDTAPGMVFLASADGTITYRSASYAAYSGVVSLDPGFRDRVVHPDDLGDLLARWRDAIRETQPVEATVRMRRHDGVYRWHLMRVKPETDGNGEVQRWVGTSTDVDEQYRLAESLRFLTAAGETLGASLDIDRTLRSVAQLAVPSIADWCLIALVADDRRRRLVALEHRDPELAELAATLQRAYPSRPSEPTARALAGETVHLPEVSDEDLCARAHDMHHLEALRRLDIASLIAVPLVSRERVLGAMLLVRNAASPRFGEADVELATMLAARAGLAVDNARIYDRERRIADTFQRTALPRSLPAIPGFRISVHYAPAGTEAEIGGDWYDAFEVDGRLVVSIGDVLGKGVEAAVTMARLRTAIRTVALQGDAPDAVLHHVNRAQRAEDGEPVATAIVASFDPRTRALAYASCGHPAPLLRRADGGITALELADAPPLGVVADLRPPLHHATIPRGTMLLFYTDGLSESTADILTGEARVAAAFGDPVVPLLGRPAQWLHDAVLFDGARDDVALLVLADDVRPGWHFAAEDAAAAHVVRGAFVAYLMEQRGLTGSVDDAEVIFGELVSNVVRHAPGPIEIAVTWNGDGGAVLDVLDRGAGLDGLPPQRIDYYADAGRGFSIIRALTDAPEVRRLPGGGSHVRVQLPVSVTPQG